jgi:hypothetical protein
VSRRRVAPPLANDLGVDGGPAAPAFVGSTDLVSLSTPFSKRSGHYWGATSPSTTVGVGPADACSSAARVTMTGQCACRTQCSLVEPSSRPVTGPRPVSPPRADPHRRFDAPAPRWQRAFGPTRRAAPASCQGFGADVFASAGHGRRPVPRRVAVPMHPRRAAPAGTDRTGQRPRRPGHEWTPARAAVAPRPPGMGRVPDTPG